MRYLLLALSVAYMFMGCAKNSEDKTPVRVRGANNPGGVITNTANGFQATFVNLDPLPGQDQSQAVQTLLSVTPQIQMGTLQGVAVEGSIVLANNLTLTKLGNSGGNVATNSQFVIYIVDDKTTQQGQPAIVLDFEPSATSGSNVTGAIQAGGNVNITFTDGYGSVSISGTLPAGLNSNSTFQGTVNFLNNGNGTQGPISGSLGTFNVPVCGFFHCQ